MRFHRPFGTASAYTVSLPIVHGHRYLQLCSPRIARRPKVLRTMLRPTGLACSLQAKTTQETIKKVTNRSRNAIEETLDGVDQSGDQAIKEGEELLEQRLDLLDKVTLFCCSALGVVLVVCGRGALTTAGTSVRDSGRPATVDSTSSRSSLTFSELLRSVS